ncbi:MAG: YdcF family protein [Verrucomicrobiota bacterium]
MIGFYIVRWTLRLIAAFLFLPLCFPETLLRQVGEIWNVEHPPQEADMIAVLGGGIPFRPIEAANLFHDGYAKRVLIFAPPHQLDSERARSESLDFDKPHHATAFQLLRKGGVPAAAIEVVSQPVTSTREEALLIQDWALKNRATRILVPTNAFHTRRLNWVLKRTVDCECLVVRAPFLENETWWESRADVSAFQSEIAKLVFYKIAY